MHKPLIPAIAILLAATLQMPAWSRYTTGAQGPETARELRKQRAQKNLENNRRNLDRLARDADLPAVDEALVAEYTRLIEYLADPAREGRAPGSIGIEDAAVFIENEFGKIGLTRAFDLTQTSVDDVEIITPNASYRQPMPMGTSKSATTQTLVVNDTEFAAGQDFSPLAYSGSTTASGPVVFAGYAIVSGPDSYMGFGPNEDLKGKIALCLKFEPMDEEGNSIWKEDRWSHHSRLTYKVSALERRGASAVLIVSPDSANDPTAGILDTIDSTSPPASMARMNQSGPKFDIPVLSITPETAQVILDNGGNGQTLNDLIAKANKQGVIENLDDAVVEIEVEIQRTKTYTDNVAGILRGRGDLADEFVVIGAHYDHVGYGHFGSRSGAKGTLHPGADDNASGTSGVILTAQQLTKQYEQLGDSDHARSILFLLFTAEESGLNGSKFYVDNPITDITNHEIMLNMDMIGRLGLDPLEIGGLHSSKQLRSLVTDHLDESGLIYDTKTSVGEGRSDHASFDTKKVPNIFFFTGLHDEYHTPEDTVDLIDMTGAVRVATVVGQIALGAATTREPFIHRRDPNAPGPREEQKNDEPTIRIGIIPANAIHGGLSVQRVFDDTSASNAGLQSGDLITHWNGEAITSVDSWSPVLLEHNPGDIVTLVVQRDDETLEIIMTLKGVE